MTNYPSEIIENSRSASLIESIDHLPVNELSTSGLSEPKQNWPLQKNTLCIIVREQFKMTENKLVNALRQGSTVI